jgi:pyridoxamine 5'-phosphate oxidase-like protein
MAAPRSRQKRLADAREILGTRHADVWVASASAGGGPYLVPVSFAWDGETVTIAVKASSPTARNVTAAGNARLAFGTTRDVVMVDATLESSTGVVDADAELADRYAGQADWNPLDDDDRDDYVFLVLRPQRIQVWRESNELAGRTVMRGGEWLP